MGALGVVGVDDPLAGGVISGGRSTQVAFGVVVFEFAISCEDARDCDLGDSKPERDETGEATRLNGGLHQLLDQRKY